MKNRVLVLVLGCAPLLVATNFALAQAPSIRPTGRASSRKAEPARTTAAPRIAATRPGRQPVTIPARPTGTAMKSQRPANRTGAAARQAFIQYQAANRGLPLERPAGVAMPSLSNVRHRGTNPPIIGGAANSTRHVTGALSGTGIKRRP
jgi:hypothetical protein